MSDFIYKMAWPRDNLYVECYTHQVQNFRYHWHQDEFELNILLSGRQHFFEGTDLYDLEENDVILVGPNHGHASYCDPAGTIAFVLRFSSQALKQFVKKGKMITFINCLSDQNTRNEHCYRQIRMYAAQILYFLYKGDQYSVYGAKASLEMLISTLCMHFLVERSEDRHETDETTQKIMKTVLDYMEEHSAGKITLEDIAGITGYNRTYISTLFHQTLGIRFYDYLTRLRLQKAIRELITTDKSLTDIALYNGFPDLKTFNARFREMLKVLPSEYRTMIVEGTGSPDHYERRTIPADDPLIMKKLEEYMEK